MDSVVLETIFLYLKNHAINDDYVKIAPLQDHLLDIFSASQEEKAAAKPARKPRTKKVVEVSDGS